MGGRAMSERLTVEQVAAQLHVEPYTVRAYAKAELLRGYKPGKRWLFDQADVDAFLEAGQNRPRETRRRRRRAA
jgi:excisionase family DNA binding protein